MFVIFINNVCYLFLLGFYLNIVRIWLNLEGLFFFFENNLMGYFVIDGDLLIEFEF